MDTQMNSGNTVGAFDAKTKLGQLLDRVARGETIIITRHGAPVAKLVPVEEDFDREKARRAAKELEEFSKGIHLPKGVTIRELIDEGRR